ncbi:hypothetical protein Agabi119p4_9905 [Agaricus bisporus var. burnettii]|uniref:Uncharacterized protein n=1 Tax=Agaricus bisporus var. burnettii TaxID=192524 RepID=A0A8H7C4I8_AGABI|nr:hypothetical protein Agabi119p4_9905 [Agaricus bisporus var. burnettii]
MQITPADYESSYINWSLAVISFTVLIYEYLLTFIYEVERFWPLRLKNCFEPRRFTFDSENSLGRDGTSPCFTWASILFFNISGGLKIKHLDINCVHMQIYHQFLVITIQCLVACLMIIRVYALYDRKAWVAILYAGVAVCSTGIAIWAVITSTKTAESPPVYIPDGCGVTLARTEARYLAFAWLSELMFDVLIFVMTLYKTLSLPNGNGIGLLSMLMRDGAVYFGAMVVVNIGNIITFFVGGPLSRGSLTMLANMQVQIFINQRNTY